MYKLVNVATSSDRARGRNRRGRGVNFICGTGEKGGGRPDEWLANEEREHLQRNEGQRLHKR
jgi:hypothetical protein